ncbi:hypothetical protein CBR_g52372 [Chara braunii]|uniref:Reverse transcriptase/retrotransposon-derived protein RNase H-like domain-containing protein n=1 Tax=Chara braunii TaxID=69332 RepID=A0A388K6X2_CHABU|nr:hypothetical protein CBR_g52372 [Chara braunii]|eukprot:GBG65781.1 hypothetical protein CBR_g52372 [Chara braunii]
METGGPTFVTGEIDVLDVTRALDHRIPLPIGHLLSISEQANKRMMQHCKANRKRFALARAQKAKAPTSKEKADFAPDPIRVGLIQKDDHFLRIKPIPWKSTECDIEVWGVPYSAVIDSGAAVLAISLRVVERGGRKNDLIMLTEKDQLVSDDEEMIKTVGGLTNVASRLGKVHALGDVVVLDVNTYDLTQGMINFYIIVYMDDILVYSDTFHGHAQHIEWSLGALRDAGFKIALEKSEFFLPEISFLGYVVTRGGLRPDSRKVAAVKEAPVPTSLTQVRAFLGLASYYRRFIKGFAVIARPLTNLLRKEQPLHWDDECDQAFEALKDALVTTAILIRPDPSRQFILITDWQPEAISTILAQKGNDGKEHVIEYASRTVPDERRNDSAPQGQCYAVVWVRLQEYEFDIVHRRTERHSNADGLTRLHRPGRPALGAPRHLAHAVAVSSVVSLRGGFPIENSAFTVGLFGSTRHRGSRVLHTAVRGRIGVPEESSEEEKKNPNENGGEPTQQQEGEEDELLQTENEEEAEEEDSEQGSGDDIGTPTRIPN